MSGISKKKRVSKRTKQSWRKHVDITDVENFLDDQRLDERLGDYSVLSNDELFKVDTLPSNAEKLGSKQAKRLKLLNAPYKCLSLLQPLTKVPDPISKRNHVKTKEERKSVIRKKRELIDKEKGILKKRIVQSVTDTKNSKELRTKKDHKFNFSSDIWSDSPKLQNGDSEFKQKILQDQWITGDSERHLLHGPGKPKKVIPDGVHKRPYVIKSVEVPHPGMSYNPSFEDHQELLREVADKEQKLIKQQEHLDRVTKTIFKKLSETENNNNWLVEMSVGLVPDKTEETHEEYETTTRPAKNKEKSSKQKRLKKEQKELALKKLQAKIERQKVTDIHRLKFIKKSIEDSEKKSELNHALHLRKKEEKLKMAKRVGPNKFEEPDLEFNMPADIRGSLRNVKKEGNPLKDRYKSLQKRNIIEPTVKKSRRKAKVKKFVKQGFKDDWKSTVAKPAKSL